MPKVPYSRSKVACGLCPYVGRSDALRRHASSKHGGKLYIKGSGFEPHGLFSNFVIHTAPAFSDNLPVGAPSSSDQSSAPSSDVHPTTVPADVPSGELPSSTLSSTASSSRTQSDALPFAVPSAASSIDASLHAAPKEVPSAAPPSDVPSGSSPADVQSDALPSATTSDASLHDPPSGVLSSGTTSDFQSLGATSGPSTSRVSGSVAKPMTELLDKILACISDMMAQQTKTDQKIDLLMQQNSVRRPKENAKENPSEVSKTLFKSGRSISALQLATGDDLVVADDGDVLFCRVCHPGFATSQHGKGTVKGVFRYPLADGRSFSDSDILPPTFRSLRTRVKCHFTGHYHAKALMEAQRVKEPTAGHFGANSSVAKRVMDAGYYVLKKSLAHAKFEDMVVMQRRHGHDIGGLNNSVGFIPKLRVQISSVLNEKLTNYFSRQPCVALCADKVTVAKRTMDITAIITLVPEAPKQEMVQAFVIGAPVVKDHSGDGLADELNGTLGKFGIKHPDQLAAICMDGQYHHLKVPEKLIQRMASNNERFATKPCVATLWDGSHLLNLAEHDARSQPDCQWVGDTIETITSVTLLHSVGKGLEELLDRSTERGEKVLRPKLWCGTRFAPYASRTLSVFISNLPTVVDLLEAEVNSGARETSKDRKLARALDVVKGETFCGRLRGLCDLYEVLADGSKSLQNLQSLPWERRDGFRAMLLKLDEMRDALDDEEDREKLWPVLSKTRTVDTKQVTELRAFTSALIRHCELRDRGQDNRGNKKGSTNHRLNLAMLDIRAAADLIRLKQTGHVEHLKDVERRIKSLRDQALIPASAHVGLESLTAAYRVLTEASGSTNQELLVTLHKEAQAQPLLKPYVDLVVRLWLIFPPESVVESMASVVEDVFGQHRQLKHENAEMELNIRWNGPDVHHAGDLLSAVQKRFNNVFVRKTSNITASISGSVYRKHVVDRKCRRAPVLRC